ncbi:hypothetical protein JA1_003484 [Spathaspora sp. JA1]|nr:hypothetical protein JA1_003484 [Spathaspora sp. JA1]
MFNIDDDLKLVILDYHNYHQCISLDHTLITTWNYFHALIPQLTLEDLKSIIGNQDIIRKNAVLQVNYQLLVEYLLKIYTPDLDLDKVLALIEHFISTVHNELPDVKPEGILALIDILNVYYEQERCGNVEDQLRKLYGKFEDYTPNNVYYVSELNLTIKQDMASIAIIGNLTGTEFLDPFVVSSVCSISFNYFPTGMFNPYQFYIYLLRMNFEFQLQQRKVLLICSNNCRLINYEFSNIEVFYIDETFDKYYNPEFLRFPDEYGLKDLIYGKLSKTVVDETSIAVPSLLFQYNKIRDELIHDPLLNQFNRLNIQRAGFVPGSYFNFQGLTERITYENNKLILDKEILNEHPTLDYHYTIEHIYSIFEKLGQFRVGCDEPSTISLPVMVEFFTRAFFPKLIADKCGLYQPFALLFNELLQSYSYTKPQINSSVPQFNLGTLSEDQKELYSTGIDLDRELRGDATVDRSFWTSVFSSGEHETSEQLQVTELAQPVTESTPAPIMPPPALTPPQSAPCKRKSSIDDPNGTIKKSKIIERLQRDRLNFVSMFDDDIEDDVEDSFDTKIQRFKYVPNGTTNGRTPTVSQEPSSNSTRVEEDNETEPNDVSINRNQSLHEQSIDSNRYDEISEQVSQNEQINQHSDVSTNGDISSSEESDSESESSSEEESYSEYVESDEDEQVQRRSPRRQTTPLTIHPSQFYKTSVPRRSEIQTRETREEEEEDSEDESDDYSSTVESRGPITMSSPVQSEEEDSNEEEDTRENITENDNIEQSQVENSLKQGQSDEESSEGESSEEESSEEESDVEMVEEQQSTQTQADKEAIHDGHITEKDNELKQQEQPEVQEDSDEESSEESSSDDSSSEEDSDMEIVDEQHLNQTKAVENSPDVHHENIQKDNAQQDPVSSIVQEQSDEESSEESSSEEDSSEEDSSEDDSSEEDSSDELPIKESVVKQSNQIEQQHVETPKIEPVPSDDSSSSEESSDDESSSSESEEENIPANVPTNKVDNVSSSTESSSEEDESESKDQTKMLHQVKVAPTPTIKSPKPLRRMMPLLSDVKLPVTTIETKSSPIRQIPSPTKSKFKLANDSDSESESSSDESESSSDSDSESSSDSESESSGSDKDNESDSESGSDSESESERDSKNDTNSGNQGDATKVTQKIPAKLKLSEMGKVSGNSKDNKPIMISDSSDSSDTDSDGSIGF